MVMLFGFSIFPHFTVVVVLSITIAIFYLVEFVRLIVVSDFAFIPFSVLELASNNGADGFLFVCLGTCDGTGWTDW